jgi:hypothetical protein
VNDIANPDLSNIRAMFGRRWGVVSWITISSWTVALGGSTVLPDRVLYAQHSLHVQQ